MELRLDLALSTNPGRGSDPTQDCRNKKRARSLIRDESNRNADVKEVFVVGWPPVKSWRKELRRHIRRGCSANYVNVENSGGAYRLGGERSNSVYVKVKMEGFGITRKLDLRLHHSYQTLHANLIALFGKCEEDVGEYKLIYQNKDGDWLHARDVPWGIFIRSVQRLKLERKCH